MSLPRLYTVREVAEFLNSTPSTIYDWVSLGRIPYLKINGLVRFRASDFEAWLAGCEVGTFQKGAVKEAVRSGIKDFKRSRSKK